MMMIYTHDISNLYADADTRCINLSRITRSYTLWSVPSSPGRSTLTLTNINLDSLDSWSYLAHPSWIAIYLNVHNSIVQLRDHNSCFSVLFVLSSSCLDFKLPYYYHTTTILLPYYIPSSPGRPHFYLINRGSAQINEPPLPPPAKSVCLAHSSF